MQINIKATGIELTQAISDYAYKRISTIEKYLDKQSGPSAIAQVEVGKSTRHHKAGNIFRAEVHIIGTNLDAYAVSEMEDLYAAIDVVKDEIVHNVLQLKGRRETLARRSAGMMKNVMKGIISSFKKRK
ncbi:MAG: ribosome-associated translation inhibitor RaiA [Candidatus Zambryskibacteria bacterium]|nr:ribosome-associated translation inhibitor RaiA [Candidatus Zambryskibacteria bacterium]